MTFTVEKLDAAKVEISMLSKEQQQTLEIEYAKIENDGIEFVFVKDSEGYVAKKLRSEIASGEKIISEKEYMKRSGLSYCEKKFGRGGARENAGRKTKFSLPLKFQIRVTQEEKDFISYAREHNFNFAKAMQG